MPTAESPSRNALDGESWRAYLAEIVTDDPLDGARIGRRRLSPSDLRQLHRWRHEGARPGFFKADEFLIRYGLRIDLFFGFAESMARSPWAYGTPPAWHEEDWSWEDANWREPVTTAISAASGGTKSKPVASRPVVTRRKQATSGNRPRAKSADTVCTKTKSELVAA